jgi:TonB family protein
MVGTIAGISVVLVASVVLLRPHRAQIGEFIGDLKRLPVGEALPTEVDQPAVAKTTKSGTSKLSFRGPGPAKAQEGAGGGPSSPSTAGLEGNATTPLKESEPLQLQVQEHDNQRRVVQLRSGPVVKLRDWGAEGRIEVSGELPENQEMPRYPTVALRDGVQGTVVLRALVGKNGRVQNVQVLSGPSLLASAAVGAVRRWRYEPSVQNGELVSAWKQITVEFTISTK